MYTVAKDIFCRGLDNKALRHSNSRHIRSLMLRMRTVPWLRNYNGWRGEQGPYCGDQRRKLKGLGDYVCPKILHVLQHIQFDRWGKEHNLEAGPDHQEAFCQLRSGHVRHRELGYEHIDPSLIGCAHLTSFQTVG